MQNPDEILARIKKAEQKKSSGQLKIFFGMCAGVGKTYAMLIHARQLLKSGKRIIVGYVETHGREETARLLNGLELIPRARVQYRGVEFEEFDLEKALELKPDYILVDELAHTNIPGLKHNKRFQDVLELIENGINVLTTLNVQHIESRSKTVEQITGTSVHETVPDSVLEIADSIELVDIPIEELQQRLKEGKVYIPEKALMAAGNFFKTGNLISLREMSLRLTAERVESDLVNYMSEQNIPGPWKAGDKLMVAVGPGPFSAELIRWTRRMAYTMKTNWYAVYVKTDIEISEKDREQLDKNLRLAKELGAEVITSADTDLVNGLIEIARRNNISQIIIGKPGKYNIINYLSRKNYVDRLIKESGNIDIYIVRPELIKNSEIKKQSQIKLNSKPKEYLWASLSVLFVAAVCFPLSDFIGYQSVGLIMLFNLLLLPFYVGRGAIIIGAVLNFLLWNFFFIPPLFTFEIAKLHDVLTLLLNMLVAITTGFLATKIRKQEELVRAREKHTHALLNFTKELSESSGKYDAISIALRHIDLNLKTSAVFFDSTFNPIMSSGETYQFDERELNIVKWTYDNNQIAGKFTGNLPTASGQYHPINTQRKKIGVLCILNSRKFTIEEESLINNIISQLASVYENEESEEMLQKLQIETESKKLYDTLLDSISHEFRTPIAVVSGSATSLLEKNINENSDLVSNFANEIFIASKRLNLLVENLLDITRLESGHLRMNCQACNINDIITDVVSQLKDEGNKYSVELDLSPDIEISIIDYGFVTQAFFNILHNSFTYPPAGSTINIKTRNVKKMINILIADNGSGLNDESLKRLFEKFYRPPGTKAGGPGLGLSIAKGFIEAHNGKIEVRQNSPNGLIFDILIPVVYEKVKNISN
jgi:two-component system sensor histidine kinase KdpD